MIEIYDLARYPHIFFSATLRNFTILIVFWGSGFYILDSPLFEKQAKNRLVVHRQLSPGTDQVRSEAHLTNLHVVP